MLTETTQRDETMTQRRMDVELTAEEIQQIFLLAIRERSRTHDQDPKAVNLARKFAEYRRQALS
jgi:hypothetical protein